MAVSVCMIQIKINAYSVIFFCNANKISDKMNHVVTMSLSIWSLESNPGAWLDGNREVVAEVFESCSC